MKLSLVKNQNISSRVSDLGKALPPSGIREFFDIVYSTPDCISLGVGEPDFVTPWRISDAGILSIKDGYTHYTPNKGIIELRQLVSDYVMKRTGIEYSAEEEIFITLGVSQGLDVALRSIVNPGDEVIFFEPCYVSYPATIQMAQGVPIAIPMYFKDNFSINLEALEKAITGKTKAILLNYPGNPTGATIDRNTLKAIAGLAVKHNLIVLSDEIYESLTYDTDHFSIISLPGMKDRTIYLNGFSKSHAMTGWRLGYTAAPRELLDIMVKIHQYTALCAPSVAQYAAIEAVSSADKDVSKMKSHYLKRRNFIVNRFRGIGLPCHMPEGAFYVFPDISSTGLNAKDFALELLKSDKVAVVPGNAFGSHCDNHIRCSFATSIENLKEAMKRIQRFVASRG
ncbi:MAG: aminotransferase class I/II-fold pyridoxal phosphate-dependent enzyme [Spirochaetota bacterium]